MEIKFTEAKKFFNEISFIFVEKSFFEFIEKNKNFHKEKKYEE